ncbi:2830_t:CDS:1, partial [Funneliformis mosseae]
TFFNSDALINYLAEFLYEYGLNGNLQQSKCICQNQMIKILNVKLMNYKLVFDEAT